VLWIQGLTAVFLVQVRRDMALVTVVTALLLGHRAMDRGTDCSVISTGERENGSYACCYCSTVTSLCYG